MGSSLTGQESSPSGSLFSASSKSSPEAESGLSSPGAGPPNPGSIFTSSVSLAAVAGTSVPSSYVSAASQVSHTATFSTTTQSSEVASVTLFTGTAARIDRTRLYSMAGVAGLVSVYFFLDILGESKGSSHLSTGVPLHLAHRPIVLYTDSIDVRILNIPLNRIMIRVIS